MLARESDLALNWGQNGDKFWLDRYSLDIWHKLPDTFKD